MITNRLNSQILFILILFMLISTYTLFSIGKISFLYRQILFWFLFFLIILSSPIIKYDALFKSHLFYFVYFISILVLLSLFLIPSKDRVWLNIGNISIQPSEFVRITLIITLTLFLSKYYHLLNKNYYLILSFLSIAPFVILIFLQPDLGMFLLFFLTWLISVLIFLSPYKILKIGILITLLTIVSWFLILKDYQKERILTLINPYKDPLKRGYNLIQLRIAIGSAGLFGKGSGENTQAKLGFLPSAHTDFILASFIEERGFWGLFLYSFLFIIFLSILYYENKFITDNIAKTFTNILILHLGLRFLITVGVNLSILPIVGLSIPFLSYGGSHLISDAILISIWHSLRYK